MYSPEDADEGAAMLRRLIAAVEAGDLDADSPKGFVLLHQLEGAAEAWQVAADSRPQRPS